VGANAPSCKTRSGVRDEHGYQLAIADRPGAVLGSWNGLGLTQSAGEPVLTNELPQVLWEPVRLAQRPFVTHTAFPDAVAGVAIAPAQLGQLLATWWAAEQELDSIVAFSVFLAVVVYCLSFLKVYTAMRAVLVPPLVCRCIRRSMRRSLELPCFNFNHSACLLMLVCVSWTRAGRGGIQEVR